MSKRPTKTKAAKKSPPPFSDISKYLPCLNSYLATGRKCTPAQLAELKRWYEANAKTVNKAAELYIGSTVPALVESSRRKPGETEEQRRDRLLAKFDAGKVTTVKGAFSSCWKDAPGIYPWVHKLSLSEGCQVATKTHKQTVILPGHRFTPSGRRHNELEWRVDRV